MADDIEKNEKKPTRASSETFWRQVWRRYKRRKAGVLGLSITGIILILGILAPALASDKPLICKYDGSYYAPALKELLQRNIPYGKKVFSHSFPFDQVTFDWEFRHDPERGDWKWSTLIPYGPLQTDSRRSLEKPSSDHWLGTDEVGRDLTARMIHGARVSMMVGFVSVSISTFIGLVLGALAGYFGSWVDALISRLIEIMMCFPAFFLILTILAMAPKPTIWLVMLVIGITSWTGAARYVRGEFIRLRDSEYSMAARALGAGAGRIIFRHILPNALAPLFVSVSFGIASAILTEAGLSYLGVGVQPPNPSWGSILQAGFSNILTTGHMIGPPAVGIFCGVLSYNLVGDSLRDAIDPRLART